MVNERAERLGVKTVKSERARGREETIYYSAAREPRQDCEARPNGAHIKLTRITKTCMKTGSEGRAICLIYDLFFSFNL